MRKNHLIDKLVAVEPGEFPFISLYLNTEPNETGKKDFETFLRKQIKEKTESFPEESAERASFEQDAVKIEDFFRKLRPSARGAAVFTSSGSNFFSASEFDVPFPEDYFFVNDKPHIFPLVRIVEQNPPFAVVLADTNAAHIFVFRGGETLEQEDIQNTKTNRSEVGGWSQMRFQRHVENFHAQHAKEVIAELDKIAREMQINRIVLSGDETVIMPLLRDELTKELEDKVVGTLRLNVNTPEHEIRDAADELIREHDAKKDKERIEYLFEHNYDGGAGVVGVQKTLEALLNGQVQELFIAADFGTIDYNIGAVAKTLKDYEPGEEGELPNAKEPGELVDELLRRAAGTADNIRFIEDSSLLKDIGGVGAILRYTQAKGVSS